jgi:uncharacterized protein YsxB (DUF464 family)
MTRVVLSRRENGSFVCRAQGHAGFKTRGNDIVCAAVTILLRATAQTLEQTQGLTVTPLEMSEGLLSFNAKLSAAGEKPPEALTQRLKTAGDVLKTGLVSLVKEYPEHVEFREEYSE